MRSSFTTEELEQYKDMMRRIKKETDTNKTPKLFGELDKWLQHKGFTDEIIDRMDKRIKAEEKGFRVVK
jgi:hypothetical protein